MRFIGLTAVPTADELSAEAQQAIAATRFRTSIYPAVQAEWLALDQSTVQVRESRRTLTIPVAVLTRGEASSNPAADEI